MPYNKYHIDFKNLLIQLLPKPLRKVKWLSFLLTLISPVIGLYNAFMAFRNLMLYRLTITPQVCFLEKMLNDRYDPIERRIWIDDAKVYDYIYVFLKVEDKPVYFYKKSENKPVYMYTRAETNIFGADFTINIPLAVVYNMNELIALVNSYKLASKKFKIVNV